MIKPCVVLWIIALLVTGFASAPLCNPLVRVDHPPETGKPDAAQPPSQMKSSPLKTADLFSKQTNKDPNKISLSFRDIDIRDAFSAMAMEFKTNIVLTGAVTGKITLHLFESTLENAIQTIAMAGGYTILKKDGTFHIIKSEKTALMDEDKTEPFVIRIFRLNFVEIEKIKEVLNALPGLQPIEVHEATKTIFVQDTPKNIQKIEQIIGFIDAVPKQMVIEAQILEVTLTDDMAYGVDWKQLFSDVNIATSGFSSATLPDGPGISPVPANGKGIFANIFAQNGSRAISVAIDALKKKTTVNTVSTPKILAINNKPARVQVGGQQGYKVTTSNQGVSTETIQFIDTGVILEITPHIDQNDNILLEVLPAINTAKIEQGIPVVNSTTVSTFLITRSGSTVFIGGLIENSSIKSREQVPLLGDLPILGILFGRNITSQVKTELVVLITPRIIDSLEGYDPRQSFPDTESKQ